MHVLVTGSTGFLGKSVVNYLKNNNCTVRALGRSTELLNQLNADERVVCDLVKDQNVSAFVDGCDAIVHCAALSAPWGKALDFIDINLNATQKLAHAALNKKIKRFVYISSPSVYIGMEKKTDIKESDPLPKKFINHYARTKHLAEKTLETYHAHGLQTIIIRPQALFGPYDTVLMPRFLKANQKIGVPLIHGGNHKIDLTFVDNVSHAIYLALQANHSAIGKTFNITNDEPVIFKDFIECFFKKLNIEPKFKKIPFRLANFLSSTLEITHKLFHLRQEPVLTCYAVKVLSESRVLNIDNAKNFLGYKPIFTLQQGIEKYANWWTQNDKKFSNY